MSATTIGEIMNDALEMDNDSTTEDSEESEDSSDFTSDEEENDRALLHKWPITRLIDEEWHIPSHVHGKDQFTFIGKYDPNAYPSGRTVFNDFLSRLSWAGTKMKIFQQFLDFALKNNSYFLCVRNRATNERDYFIAADICSIFGKWSRILPKEKE